MKTANFLFRKTLFGTILACLLANALFSQSNIQQLTSINGDGAAPDPSAMLDVQATDKGMLVPRMTSMQRTAILAPATGLLIFDTTTGGFWFYNGTTWQNLSTLHTLQDADGDTKVQVEKNPNEDIIRFDLGGTENMVLSKNAGGSPRLELNNVLNNNFVGTGAGQSNTTGSDNTANGVDALFYNTTGSDNTANGMQALYSNTTGNSNTATGKETLYFNDAGSGNTVSGFKALYFNTSGSDNTVGGVYSMYKNTTGGGSTAYGAFSLQENTAGMNNTAFGNSSLFNNTTGNDNTATGAGALASNTTGSFNTANGISALSSNTTGNSNVAIGNKALYWNDTHSNLVAVGDSALYNNGVGATGTFEGKANTAVGKKALFSNTTGYYNTANGRSALFSNTTGFNNTANGGLALYNNTTGNYNTANGAETLCQNTTGSYNTANGYYALHKNTTGDLNTANGLGALSFNTTGSGNTANGRAALPFNTTGNNNTANGVEALYQNETGSNNTALGYRAGVNGNNRQNATAIGNRAEVNASNSLVLGSVNGFNGATASVKVGIGDTAPSHYLTVKSATDNETMRLIGNLGMFEYGARLNFGDGDIVYIEEPTDDELRIQANSVGINRTPLTNDFEVEGNASKSSAGDWLANSDARLKKNIQPLNSQLMLQNLLALRGVTYEWNDDKTGSKRPEGIQYGFTAQNIREVFPTLVEEDKLGYLQTAYGTYDAMTVEAIRALHEEIGNLKMENAAQKAENAALKSQLDKITAALQSAGIAVEK